MAESANRGVISACGLFCGTCRRYVSGKCVGCAANESATWCKVRACCKEHNFCSCAECDVKDVDSCAKFNSFISKVFKFVFRSDRKGCVERIREVGYDKFAEEMRLSGCYNRPVKH